MPEEPGALDVSVRQERDVTVVQWEDVRAQLGDVSLERTRAPRDTLGEQQEEGMKREISLEKRENNQ